MKHLLYTLLLGSFCLNALSMEHQSSEKYFDLLPNEVVDEVFLYTFLSSNNQKEMEYTIACAQLVEKRWLLFINDKKFTKKLISLIYNKFITKSEFDLYNLLHITQESKTRYQTSIKILKTITQYALLHHNELTQDTESQEFPWMRLAFGSYCTALRKSYRKILDEVNAGKEFTDLAQSINNDFEKLTTQQPQEVKKLYPLQWNPYNVTAELLYLYNNTEEVAQAALRSPNISERLLQFTTMTSNLENMFTHSHAWQPTYLRITDAFRKDNGSLKQKYLELSQKLYIFT